MQITWNIRYLFLLKKLKHYNTLDIKMGMWQLMRASSDFLTPLCMKLAEYQFQMLQLVQSYPAAERKTVFAEVLWTTGYSCCKAKLNTGKVPSIICWVYEQNSTTSKTEHVFLSLLARRLLRLPVTHNSSTHSKRCFLLGWTQTLQAQANSSVWVFIADVCQTKHNQWTVWLILSTPIMWLIICWKYSFPSVHFADLNPWSALVGSVFFISKKWALK